MNLVETCLCCKIYYNVLAILKILQGDAVKIPPKSERDEDDIEGYFTPFFRFSSPLFLKVENIKNIDKLMDLDLVTFVADPETLIQSLFYTVFYKSDGIFRVSK